MKSLLAMLGFGKNSECRELADKMAALNRSQAVIEFDLQGNIIFANQLFLAAMGYRLEEVVGKHHRIFVDPGYAQSPEYENFWADLARGQHSIVQVPRITKSGQKIWVQGSYNPLLDEDGNPYKVVKFATDITLQRAQGEHSNALRVCEGNVLLSDLKNKIVFVNNSASAMFRKNESHLQKMSFGFKADNMLGLDLNELLVDHDFQKYLADGSDRQFNKDVIVGELVFEVIATPWCDQRGEKQGFVVELNDKTRLVKQQQKEREEAYGNLRVRGALDVCQMPVMVADSEMIITYLNDAASKMIKAREVEIKKALPNFSADKLLGTCIDDFHKNPSHQRQLVSKLSRAHSSDITISEITFGLTATPIRSESGEFVGTVVEWDDKTERLAAEIKEREESAENARVRQALDNVSTNVMIADADARIIYANKAVESMLKKAESDIKKDIPSFDTRQVMGSNIDVFHKVPSRQRNLLENLTSTYRSGAKIGGRTFTLVANPVFQGDKRVGTVVEWADRTAEVAIEKEIDTMVDAASAGDFSVHISTEGKEGFFLGLSKGLNNLVSTVEVALNDILRMLGAMAKGDLSERITRDYTGAFGQMKNDANITANKLTEVITNIRLAASSIATSADEISQGNVDLSQRTEEQASSLEETAASMEEMTSTVKQSADNAESANKMSAEAQALARDGGTVVKEAVVAMEEINKSSKRISDIIGVIDEIAFQTNLLALNAAVEAARAGEQGRGFAVVAGEVRNLAQRSAAAAKEIKDLIRESVSSVSEGTGMVNKSGAVLTQIVTSVDKVTSMMEEIASASREQSNGIEQVNTAVTQMDEMTQQNAALVEEAASAGQAMSDQARSLNGVVEFFTFNNSSSPMLTSSPSVPVAAATFSESMPSSPTKKAVINEQRTPELDDEWEEF